MRRFWYLKPQSCCVQGEHPEIGELAPYALPPDEVIGKR